MATQFDTLDAKAGSFKTVTQLPSTPSDYYGAGGPAEWIGGETVYHNGSGTGGDKLYIQTATSGTTPTWKKTSAQFVTF